MIKDVEIISYDASNSRTVIKTDSIVYFTLPNSIKNNSFHIKYDSNKVVHFDSITLAN